MKLKFKQQEFQTDAVNAVCALFDGQQQQTSTFSMEQSGGQMELFASVGVSNCTALQSLSSLCRASLSARAYINPCRQRRSTFPPSMTTPPAAISFTTARSCPTCGSLPQAQILKL